MKLFLVYLFACLVLSNAELSSKLADVSPRLARSEQARPASLESAPQPQVVHPSGQGAGPSRYAFGPETGPNAGQGSGQLGGFANFNNGPFNPTGNQGGFHYSTAAHVPLFAQTGPGHQGSQAQAGQTGAGSTLTSTLGRSWHLMPVASHYTPAQLPQYGGPAAGHSLINTQGEGQGYQPTGLAEIGSASAGTGATGGSPLLVSFVPYGSNQPYGPAGQAQPSTGVSYAPLAGPFGSGAQTTGPYGTGAQTTGPFVTYGGSYGGPQTGGPVVPYAAVGGHGAVQYQPTGLQTGVVAYSPVGMQAGGQFQPGTQQIGGPIGGRMGGPLGGSVVSYAAFGGQGSQVGGPMPTYSFAGGQETTPNVVPYSTFGGQGATPNVAPYGTFGGQGSTPNIVPYGPFAGQGPIGYQPMGSVITYPYQTSFQAGGPQGGPLGPYAVTGGQGQGPSYFYTGSSARAPGQGPTALVTEVVPVSIVGQYSTGPFGMQAGHPMTSFAGQGQGQGQAQGQGQGQTPTALHYGPSPRPIPGPSAGPNPGATTGQSYMGSFTGPALGQARPGSTPGQMGAGLEGGIGGPSGVQESQLTGRSANLGNIAQTTLQNW